MDNGKWHCSYCHKLIKPKTNIYLAFDKLFCCYNCRKIISPKPRSG